MTIVMMALIIYLVYVSYCKIVCLLFRGKQHNRFFGTFLSTLVPVIGSFPVVVMATKYEKTVQSLSSRMNEEILRYCIVALQMIAVFMLFAPFLYSDNGYTNGINLIFGNEIYGSDILKPSVYMIYLVVAPFIVAVLNIADRKYNIRNVISYWISLFICLSMLGFFIVLSSEGISTTILFWLHCAVNVTSMLLSIFSVIVVRNKQLLIIEQEEKSEYIQLQKERNKRTNEPEADSDTYKCAKCGNSVKKGEICDCIASHKTLSSVMKQAYGEEESSNLCIHCKRTLADGEVCNCIGNGFGITVKSQPYNGRKCKYCGQQIVGESLCVCEKILKNSQPSDEPVKIITEPEPDVESIMKDTADELNELEKKINQKFSDIKSHF